MNPAQATMALKSALAKRYEASEWAFFPELRNGTGSSFTRSADGFAMSLYPSRGIEFHGFEIKASTGDLAAEIRHPEKADAVGRFVDRWWIVTTRHVWSKKGAEIPTAWGVMTLQDNGGLRIVRQAAAITSEPISRALLASIVLRSRQPAEDELERARSKGFSEGFARGQEKNFDTDQLKRIERDRRSAKEGIRMMITRLEGALRG